MDARTRVLYLTLFTIIPGMGNAANVPNVATEIGPTMRAAFDFARHDGITLADNDLFLLERFTRKRSFGDAAHRMHVSQTWLEARATDAFWIACFEPKDLMTTGGLSCYAIDSADHRLIFQYGNK
jgi:hypothetical protein